MGWADEGGQVTVSRFRVWMAIILAFACGYGLAVFDVIRVLILRG